MAHFPSNAPALAGAAEPIAALPTKGQLRNAVAAGAAEAAVLLIRGSAAAVILSPLLIAAFILAR